MIEKVKTEDLFNHIDKLNFNMSDKMQITQPFGSHMIITNGEICESCKQRIMIKDNPEVDKINKYSKNQSTLYGIIKLLVKDQYGGWVGLDRKLGKKNYSQRAFQNMIKKDEKLYNLIDCKPYIKSKL